MEPTTGSYGKPLSLITNTPALAGKSKSRAYPEHSSFLLRFRSASKVQYRQAAASDRRGHRRGGLLCNNKVRSPAEQVFEARDYHTLDIRNGRQGETAVAAI